MIGSGQLSGLFAIFCIRGEGKSIIFFLVLKSSLGIQNILVNELVLVLQEGDVKIDEICKKTIKGNPF